MHFIQKEPTQKREDFVNKLNIRTTRYVSIENKSDLDSLGDFLPGILKTTTHVFF